MAAPPFVFTDTGICSRYRTLAWCGKGIKKAPGIFRGQYLRRYVSCFVIFIGQGRLAFHGPDSFQRMVGLDRFVLLDDWIFFA